MASTSFGFFGAAPAWHTAANTHSRTLFMRSRFSQGITQFHEPSVRAIASNLLSGVRGVYSAFGCQRPVAVQFQVEYARNTLNFLWLQFGHENAPWEARIGEGNDP